MEEPQNETNYEAPAVSSQNNDGKVSIEIATKTITGWMDRKKIKPTRREALKAHIDILTDAVVSGNLSVDENNVFHYELDFPVTSGSAVTSATKIKFKPRINETMKNQYRRSVTGTTYADQLLLTLLTLTDVPKDVINALDESTDRQVADSIALFFM